MTTPRTVGIVALLAVAIGFSIGDAALAGDYYVSFSGSDLAGNGSAASPWRTITHALKSIPAPSRTETQTIHVGPGHWHAGPLEAFPLEVPQGVILAGAGVDITVLSGVKAASRRPVPSYGQVLLRFRASPGGPDPAIAPAQVTGLTMMHARAAVEVAGDVSRVPEPFISGVRFWRNQIGVQITNAAPRVEDCRFDSNNMGLSSGRITTVGNETLIRRNIFLKNAYGINAANSLKMVVEFNWFQQNGIGIMLGTVGLVTARPILRNNVYFKNGQGYTGTAVLGGRMMPLIVHETFYGNQTGIASLDDQVFGGRSDPDIRNCIIWASQSADLNGVSREEIRNSDLSTAINVAIGPIIGLNGIRAEDPRFVDAARGDLHLSDRSPLIDKGVNDYVGAPATDLDGEPRTTNYPDLGADEAQSFLVHSRSASRARELKLVLTAREDGRLAYVLAASFISDPAYGIPIGERVIPLYPDSLFYDTVGFNGRIRGFFGQLNGAGQAVVRAFVPDWPWLRGKTLYVAYVTLDSRSPFGIKTISNVVPVALDRL